MDEEHVGHETLDLRGRDSDSVLTSVGITERADSLLQFLEIISRSHQTSSLIEAGKEVVPDPVPPGLVPVAQQLQVAINDGFHGRTKVSYKRTERTQE